ncbi:hypothetical protein ABZ442_29350 [Streptomyces triculaminicus]|uniref:hypothetical protein n=1 Tax=Streptomyces triculaminicus TaxID=2816232 RepID=UPI0033C22B7B
MERHTSSEMSLLPLPHFKRRTALALLGFAALLWALHAVGGSAPQQSTGNGWGPFGSVVEWCMQCLAGVGALLKGGDKGALIEERLGCLLLFLVVLVLLRRAMLGWYAYRPGPVDVRALAASDPDVEPKIEGLTAQLRKHLSETNLYPPTSLPAEPPAANFLDLLGDIDAEPTKLGTSLVRLVSRIRPRIAYTIRGVLRVREREPSRGVTITVTSYVTRGSRTETLWEGTWEDAVRSAGNWVMASLVPVTRAARRPPWEGWRGRDLPPGLFAAYQEGRRLSRERKFDDALERYYAALRFDPANLYLRTQIAATQEQLWLHIDALETYYGAMLLDGCTAGQRERLLTAAPWDPRRRFWRRPRWRRQGLLEVRYRFAVLLGVAERTATQWCVGPSSDRRYPRRARTRDQICEALAPALANRYWRIFTDWLPPKVRTEASEEERVKGWIADLLGAYRKGQEPLVRLVLQSASVAEMRQVTIDSLWCNLPSLVGFGCQGTLTRPSLRLNRDVWAPLRLAWVVAASPYRVTGGTPAWLTSPSELQREVRRALDWPFAASKQRIENWFPRPRRPWQDSYNAACVYAVAMNHPRFGESDRTGLAALAVRDLEDATRMDRRGTHALMRSWLLVQDADLSELRGRPCFVRFEREAYPHAAPDHHRPGRPVAAEMQAYHCATLRSTARIMEHTWRARKGRVFAEPHNVAQWLRDDHEVWDAVGRFAREAGSDWRDRERLVEIVRRVADPALPSAYGLPPGLPELDDLLDEAWFVGGAAADGWADDFDRWADGRLSVTGHALTNGPLVAAADLTPGHRCEQWLEAARRDRALSLFLARPALWQMCWDFEAAWRALGDQFDPGRQGRDLGDALRRFRQPRDTWHGLTAV